MRIAAALIAAACCAGADLPLGLVERVDKDAVAARFDAAARIAPGQMVALYGPGAVVKHPLTGKVVTENRKLLAKAQVLGADGPLLKLRVLWKADGVAAAEAGWDAVPLPGEAAPNGPPALTAAVPAVTAAPGTTVTIKIPVADPDGDPLSCAWELAGAAGRCGRLDSHISALPEVVWTAPAAAPEGGIQLKLVVRDPLGQEVAVAVPLALAGNDDPHRPRKAFAAYGYGQEPTWVGMARGDDGTWIGIDDGGKVLRVAAGWAQSAAVAFAGESAPRKPLTVALRGKELYVLDAGKQQVAVFTDSGSPRRVLAGLAAPTDLAVGADGSVWVADAGSGGVMAFEPNGRFRARLGRNAGEDGFTRYAPTRVCLAPDGTVVALDPEARRLQRYGSDLRRLDTWTITGDPKLAPVDIAWHPRGLLVLLADGSVQLFGGKGTVAETWKPAAASGLLEDPGEAATIDVDPSGETVVAYPRNGALALHAGDGRLLGVRAPGLRRSQSAWAVDGLGRSLGLDTDYGVVWVYDGEGWRTARAGGRARDGGPFSQAGAMAASPDGSALAVIDADKRSVIRFDGHDWRKAPLVFANRGKNNGQLESPVSIALDEAGRCYVLDEDQYRVSVFAPSGDFLFAFGEKGKDASQLYEPKQVAVAPDGSAAWVYDENHYELKKFALDQAAKSAKHVATAGGKGYDPGQFRSVVAMAVDRGGLLHACDDSRGDWQLLDFRGSSLIAVQARKAEEVFRGMKTMAVSPDGQVWLAGGGALTGLR